VFDNVLIQPRDAREASDVFYRQRLGDVLLTYENEVVLTNQVRIHASISMRPGFFRGWPFCHPHYLKPTKSDLFWWGRKAH
jgi:hypothetical protein